MTDKHDKRTKETRRAGRPPAGAREGEKVKDYPQLSIRVPVEMKARLTALSAVTGLAQWRVIVEAIDCLLHALTPTDRQLVDGLSERLIKAG
jgi:predicted DNA-binding protein